MSLNTLDAHDQFDKHLQSLFAPMQPRADFETQLVQSLRDRLGRSISPARLAPLRKAAVAAAAVLMVGMAGYVGNQAITGGTTQRYSASIVARVPQSNLRQAGLAVPVASSDLKAWDFGGGSNSAQQWSDTRSREIEKDQSRGYVAPFAKGKAPGEGFQFKNSDNTYGIADDLQANKSGDTKTGLSSGYFSFAREAPAKNRAAHRAESEFDGRDSILLPDANGEGGDAPKLATEGGKQKQQEVEKSTAVDQAKSKLTEVLLSDTDASSKAPPSTSPVIDDRKIIRTGTMEFEVDRFDTAQMQITKIVGELGGFVGATDSQKLPNGKVRGSIAVRVPPERLDALVLSLRALGDLKSQQITAADVTKEYTDLQSELTADRAMQDRLLELIHTGKGTVKDLLAAENELGNWRGKIEKAERMIRYYNAQVAMSTLNITLSEQDIQTPAMAVETETADVGIESDDVEKSRASALKLIEDAKGRLVEAELKRFDAGQLAARLVVDVPPESAGAVIDQLKLLGKISRLEIHRRTIDEGSANQVAAPVEANAQATAEQLKLKKEMDEIRQQLKSGTMTANKRFDLESRLDELNLSLSLSLAKAKLKLERSMLPPLRTERKATRLLISIYNLANVSPRRTTNVSLAAGDVESAYNALANLARTTGGRVVTSNLDRGDPVKASGSLTLEFPPDKLESALSILHAQGDVLKLTLTENPDTQNSTEAKIGLTVQLVSLAAVPARESVQQTLAAADVPAAYQAVISAMNTVNARVQSAQLNEQDRQNITADLQVEVPRTSLAELDKSLALAGGTISRTASRAAQVEGTVDSKVSLHLAITSSDHLPPRETTRLQIEVSDVDQSVADAQSAAMAAGGRVLELSASKNGGSGSARLRLDLPLGKSAELLQQIRNPANGNGSGGNAIVRAIDSSRDPQAPGGAMAHAQIAVEFVTADTLVADQTGPWAAVRQGLSTSITGLLWSLKMLVVGLCLIGPWLLIGWICWKIWNRKISKQSGNLTAPLSKP